MILITGNLGFIGSKLAQELTEPYIGIDLQSGLNLLTCDLPEGIDTIFHLAAQSSVESSWHDPLHDLDNSRITARLAHTYPNAKIIYANSCAAINKDSPYGFSKAVSGEYLKKFHTNTVELIFPNIYGPGSKSVVDIFKGKDEVTIYGDGTHTRDYVHVDDIVSGILKARKWEAGTYHMGTGNSIPVNELAKGKKITYLPERKETAHVMVPNTTPNWEPTISVKGYTW